jgi:murein L,D-transpeptidase YafK
MLRRGLRAAAIAALCALSALFGVGAAPHAGATTTPAPAVTRIVVDKSERRLELRGSRGVVLKRYRVSLGFAPKGHKRRVGDGRTPEGVYRIDGRLLGSAYYRALHISYPSAQDRMVAAERGENPGGQIMIHGLPNRAGWLDALHRTRDWTQGCIAVTNAEIDEIWSAVADGTTIEIRP